VGGSRFVRASAPGLMLEAKLGVTRLFVVSPRRTLTGTGAHYCIASTSVSLLVRIIAANKKGHTMCEIAGWVSYDGDLRAERESKTRRNVHDPAPQALALEACSHANAEGPVAVIVPIKPDKLVVKSTTTGDTSTFVRAL
jgi:hypothetical protein